MFTLLLQNGVVQTLKYVTLNGGRGEGVGLSVTRSERGEGVLGYDYVTLQKILFCII